MAGPWYACHTHPALVEQPVPASEGRDADSQPAHRTPALGIPGEMRRGLGRDPVWTLTCVGVGVGVGAWGCMGVHDGGAWVPPKARILDCQTNVLETSRKILDQVKSRTEAGNEGEGCAPRAPKKKGGEGGGAVEEAGG